MSACALAVIRHARIHSTKHQALAHGIVGAAADKDRGHRACQQDRANGLGHDDQGRAIQGTRRTRGVM